MNKGDDRLWSVMLDDDRCWYYYFCCYCYYYFCCKHYYYCFRPPVSNSKRIDNTWTPSQDMKTNRSICGVSNNGPYSASVPCLDEDGTYNYNEYLTQQLLLYIVYRILLWSLSTLYNVNCNYINLIKTMIFL